MAENTTDSFDGFDPTQVAGSGCCGQIYWDFTTQTWRKSATRKATTPDCSTLEEALKEAQAKIAELQAGSSTSSTDCSDLEEELLNTKSELASVKRALTQTQSDMEYLERNQSNCDEVQSQLDTATNDLDNAKRSIADLESKLASAQLQVVSLQEDMRNCAENSACDTLTKYVDKVQDLAGNTVFYGLKELPDCSSEDLHELTSLDGETVTHVTRVSTI